MDLTAIEDFGQRSGSDTRFDGLAEICARHANIWSEEAEKYLLNNFGRQQE